MRPARPYSAALQRAAAAVVGHAVALTPLLHLLLDRRPPRLAEQSAALQRAAAAVVGRAVPLAPLGHLLLDHRPLRLQEVQRLARRVLRLVREQVRARPAPPPPRALSARAHEERKKIASSPCLGVCPLLAGRGRRAQPCMPGHEPGAQAGRAWSTAPTIQEQKLDSWPESLTCTPACAWPHARRGAGRPRAARTE